MKTGYTREAGFTFLGSAERDGRRLVMVLAGSPDGNLRDRTARDLLEWGFDAFGAEMILPAHAPVGQAEVQDGASATVALRTTQAVMPALPRGVDPSTLSMEVVYRGPVEAPVAAGDRIARLRVTANGELVLEAPLEAAHPVDQANVFQRIFNAWRKWLA